MCIAIYSPKGNEIPCEEYLRNSFLYNPDGAGFAYNTKHNNVQIEKGFMDWDSFWSAFQKANRLYDFKNSGVLIHFRITTHGGTNPECCHPFPLVGDPESLRKTKVKSDYAVIHNGIISLTSSEAHSREKMSDTMVFIEKYLTKIATNKKWFRNPANFEMIYDLIDSKMAVLNGYGEIHSTYGFTKDIDGNYYSNTSYKEGRIFSKYSKPVSSNKLSEYGLYGTGTGALGTYNYWDSYYGDYDDDYEYFGSSYDKKIEVKNEKSDSNNSDAFPKLEYDVELIMKMEYNMTCQLDNNDYIDYENGIELYCTYAGELFMSDGVDDNNVLKNPVFVGYGKFIDTRTFKEVDFEPDTYIYYTDLVKECY